MSFKLVRGASSAQLLAVVLGVGCLIAGALFLGVSSTSTTTIPTTLPAPSIAPVNPPPEATPQAAKAADHFALPLDAAFNGFVGESWKRENHDDDGIPADGRVLVPGVVPRAYFQFVMPDGPNAIQLAAGTPVTLKVPAERRGKYGRLAVLSGSDKGDANIHVTLHYTNGDDIPDDLKVQDWNRHDEAKEVFVHKALKAGRVQLFSQIVKLDTARELDTITLRSDVSAVIFSMTVIVSADRPFKGGM